MREYFSSSPARKYFLIFIILLSVLTWALAKHPGHNGDMPFYIACAIEKEQGSMDAVVARTQDIIQHEIPVSEVKDHVDRIGRADPVIFEFYRVKPLYILLVLLFHKIGFTYTHATVVPSLLAYFLIGITVWRFASLQLDPFKTFLTAVLSVMIGPAIILARLSTPDALSCFIMLNALLLIYFERNKTLWFCLFVVAICTRVDNIIAEGILLFALWKWPVAGFKNKLKGKELIAMCSILVATAILINLTATHHFLWFRDSYFFRDPVQYQRDVAVYLLVASESFFMCLLILFIFSGFRRGFCWKMKENYLFYVICAVIFVRFLLYPFYEERYNSPYLLFYILVTAIYFGGNDREFLPRGWPEKMTDNG